MLWAGGGHKGCQHRERTRPFHCHAKSFLQPGTSSILQKRHLKHREVRDLKHREAKHLT